MVYVKVTSTKELEPGKMVGFRSGGKAILVANVAGNYYAIGNRCTHMGCMLTDGMLKGDVIQCSCHGSRFDVKTGNVVGGPATNPEPIFKLKVEADQIMVEL